MVRFYGDYHTHSNYSDGRAGIEEMIAAGQGKGLKEIAITDHGPKNIAGGLESSEKLLEVASKIRDKNETLNDIKVLSGVEANVIGLKGEIDVPIQIYEQLDILIIGLHPYIIPSTLADFWNFFVKNQAGKYFDGARSQALNYNTQALIEACCKHKPFAISHPGLGLPIDIQRVANACAKYNVAYEINCGHLYQTPEELSLAAKEGPEFVINSDAHYTETVGNLEPGFKLAREAGIGIRQIKNLLN